MNARSGQGPIDDIGTPRTGGDAVEGSADHARDGAAPFHAPVLVAEVLEGLAPRSGETVVDCTAGLGGHASAMARCVGPAGRVVLIDADSGNLSVAADRVRAIEGAPEVIPIQGNFSMVEALLARIGARADLVLADLGVSSNQLDEPARGLSFLRDGPLDMRLDPHLGATAADLVNALPRDRLADLIFRFGEEPFARRIAARIVEARAASLIGTTAALASLVREAYGSRARTSRMHPATRTFMALRIAVNDELGSLERLLEAVERGAASAAAGDPAWIAAGARVAIISFHSLEDRLVKQRFRELDRRGVAEVVWKHPRTATDEESKRNPRARSAKLRLLRLVGRC